MDHAGILMQLSVQGKPQSDLSLNAQTFRTVWTRRVELVFWLGLAPSWFLQPPTLL